MVVPCLILFSRFHSPFCEYAVDDDFRETMKHAYQIYDYILTFSDEINHIWRKRWSSFTIIVLATRYLPFLESVLVLLGKKLLMSHFFSCWEYHVVKFLINPSSHACNIYNGMRYGEILRFVINIFPDVQPISFSIGSYTLGYVIAECRQYPIRVIDILPQSTAVFIVRTLSIWDNNRRLAFILTGIWIAAAGAQSFFTKSFLTSFVCKLFTRQSIWS